MDSETTNIEKKHKGICASEDRTIDALYKLGLLLLIPLVGLFFYLRTDNAVDHLLNGGYFCAIRRLTGMWCPGCGGTRASFYLARFQILDSIKMNIAVPLGAAMYIIFMLVETSHRLFKTKGLKEKHFYIMLAVFVVSIIGRWIVVNFITGPATSSPAYHTEPAKTIVVERVIDTEDSEDIEDIENKEEDISQDELIMDGEKYYDLGPKSASQVRDNCFMEPILQNPTENGVTVQWFTEYPGETNSLYLYEDEEIDEDKPSRVISANTIKLSRIRGGKTDKTKDNAASTCDIYKHVAIVDGLPSYHGLISERRAYRVITDDEESEIYTLAARAVAGTPLRILLTSDHQIKNMVASNIQKVYETVGGVDAVLVNGDLVDVSDRGYDWFYADNAFFRCLLGSANDEIGGVTYYGAPLLQEAPIYTAIGNHDVMGVYDNVTPLSTQFNEPRTRQQAEEKWKALCGKEEEHEAFVENNSYNTISTEEMFEQPVAANGNKKYYATTIGDVRLISLDVSRVWRLPNVGLSGKYSEVPGLAEGKYAGGDFIFESIKEGSEQISFLDSELARDEYTNSKYKMVMFHSEAHSLGGNQIPAFTDPVAKTTVSPITGQKMTIYDYPIEEDYIINVIEPRLLKSGTNLLFEAHSHLWNRFKLDKMNILESSNVGNSYGGFDSEDNKREQMPSAFNKGDQYHSIAGEWNKDNYILQDDPNGLTPIPPNLHELPGGKSYLDSNTITSFSIMDTKTGTVDSYYFDTEDSESEVILFDSFEIVKD